MVEMSTPNSANSDAEMEIYRAFMLEIKIRTDAIDRYLARIEELEGASDTFIDAESCILQLRYICELIALSSLTAHHVEGVSSRLMKSWNAEKIFSLLKTTNPNCFPRAVTQPEGKGNSLKLRKDVMNAEELTRLYSKCGESLHRGPLKHMKQGKRRAYSPEDIVEWVNRIKGLLNMHVVMLLDRGVFWLVRMRNEEGSVDVYKLEGLGPAVLIED